ncbi:zinc finger MYM-type protein 5-like, partial [Stegodyphus dumicola]|uniref:zinc finger MYM-type protein 5-like n=1 Tax=Stegodyphus dumicola TaxID=202533 RepID=UPI0015AEC888
KDEPSNFASTSNDDEILKDISCNLHKQDEESSSIILKQTTFQQLREQPSSSTSNEHLMDVKLGYKESSHLGESGQQKEDLKTFDLLDPGSWPITEKMKDQQRSFLSSQAVLLAKKHPENIDLRSTEQDGRHLTSSLWYRTLANSEKFKRSWLVYSKPKNAIFCSPCKIYQKHATATTSALCTTGFINRKKSFRKVN